jgi:hypothetical protein
MTEIPKNLTYTIGSGSTIGIEPDHMVGLKSPQITHPGGFNLRVHYNVLPVPKKKFEGLYAHGSEGGKGVAGAWPRKRCREPIPLVTRRGMSK